MKKIYLHLMALICLLLFGGVNVWAKVYTWTGNQWDATLFYKNATSQANAVQIGHQDHQSAGETPGSPTTVYYWASTNPAYNKNLASIMLQYGETGHLFTNNTEGGDGGYVTLYIQAAKVNQYPNTYMTVKQGGNIIASCQPQYQNNTVGQGTALTFKMEKGKVYDISMPRYYVAIYIKKVVFYTPDEVEEIILDETATKATNDSKVTATTSKPYKFISSIRTLKSGQWNTFCFPMNLSANVLKENFGCTNVFEMSSYNSSGKTIAFDTKTSYSAGKPCLIQPSEDIVNPTFMIQGSLTASTQKDSNGLSFVGIYGAEDLYTNGDDTSTKFYMKNDGYLVYPTDPNKGTIKGLRAYFECANVGNLAKGLTFAFEDTQTGIKTVEFDVLDNDGRVYSIDGRYVGNSTNNLTRGIYIQNGRKFVVK